MYWSRRGGLRIELNILKWCTVHTIPPCDCSVGRISAPGSTLIDTPLAKPVDKTG